MTRADILELHPGNSVIGLWNQWTDECPVLEVGETVTRTDGRVMRPVVVRSGSFSLRGTVREGDNTIRGIWR